MAKVKKDNFAELFGEKLVSEAKNKRATEISFFELHPFRNHTYKVLDDEAMDELVESIRLNGIIEPLIVRPIDNGTGGYEIISGHRRYQASCRLGMTKLPVHIVELNDDEATIAMVDANLRRPEILPSELAFSYKAKVEAMAHMGKKEEAGKTSEQIGNEVGKSGRTIERYIRLTYLIADLLSMADKKQLSVESGYYLSFLTEDEQYSVWSIINDYSVKISAAQAQELRQKTGSLNEEFIKYILCSEKPKKQRFVIENKQLDEYFPADMPYEEREQVILLLLDKYKKSGFKE